jgi:ATP synthase protein I
MSMARNDKENRGELARALAFMSQIGITIIACIAIGVFLGRYLDNLFNTSPWLLLFFSFSGMAAAFKYIIDMAKRG